MRSMGPFAYGRPSLWGVIRKSPEDFVVEEQLGFEPDVAEQGEHLWLWIEKRGQNTLWVAQALAEWMGCHPSKVGFAGLKDRHAVTRQWISIHLGNRPDPDWKTCAIEGVSILKATRATRKIQRGRLAGNRFELTIRDWECPVGTDWQSEMDERLGRVAVSGVPNFFGEQRFGDNNVGRARRLFAGELHGKRSKPKQGFYLSAARSYLFNEVLSLRVAEQTWNRLMPGEVAQLDGSQSFFKPSEAETLSGTLDTRLESLDIHPTGPLPGIGEPVVDGDVAELERTCLAAHADLVDGLCRFNVKAMRRSLRSRVGDLKWQWQSEAGEPILRLSFGLSAGCFATTVLRELIAYQP